MANNDSSGALSHATIETNNFLMIVLILLVLLVGGLVEIVPLFFQKSTTCLLYTSPSPRDGLLSRMPSSA